MQHIGYLKNTLKRQHVSATQSSLLQAPHETFKPNSLSTAYFGSKLLPSSDQTINPKNVHKK
jgi:hypothetical protein